MPCLVIVARSIDRLQLPVRPVESHVHRACTWLGLADRATPVAAVRPGTGAVPPP